MTYDVYKNNPTAQCDNMSETESWTSPLHGSSLCIQLELNFELYEQSAILLKSATYQNDFRTNTPLKCLSTKYQVACLSLCLLSIPVDPFVTVSVL